MTFSPAPLPFRREQKQLFSPQRICTVWKKKQQKKPGGLWAIFCSRAERLADSQGCRNPACFSVRTEWMSTQTPMCLMACDRKLPHYCKYSTLHWTRAWHNVSPLTGNVVWYQWHEHESSPITLSFSRRHGSNFFFPPSILWICLFTFRRIKKKKQTTESEIWVQDFLAVRWEPGADLIVLGSEVKIDLKGSSYLRHHFLFLSKLIYL